MQSSAQEHENINTEAAQLPVLSSTDEHIDRQGERSKSQAVVLHKEVKELSDPEEEGAVQ